mmetsp:Transcript_39344/g.37774  ORF Transcript_39344/g.37774 Transcript_39344/m.37774 type:complete len:128 (+) Transcript_39344:3298-3681(+)
MMTFEEGDGEENKERPSKVILNANSTMEDYMSGINEGGVHLSKLPSFELSKVLIDSYIPEFSESDINENRHRACHEIKLEENEKLTSLITFEITSFDLKLFEGLDFDFDLTSKQSNFINSTSSGLSS